MTYTTSRLPLTLSALIALTAADVAHAEYLWVQRDADTAKVYAGELRKPLPALPALRNPAAMADGKMLTSSAQGDHATIEAATPGDLRFTATRANDKGVLTYYQAKSGRSETRAVNDLELVPTEPDGNTFKLVFKGHTVPAGQINVDTSEGWRRELTPAADGTVSFVPAFPGLYVLEVTARVDSGSVTIDGKRYDDVRHTATLSFEVGKR